MKLVTCGICRNEKTPVNSSLRIDDVVYCENCLKQNFPTDADLEGKSIVREFDPTICTQCSNDFGEVHLKHVGSYPMCDWCKQKLEARIFPNWVKAFLAGVAILVVLSLALNWRFIEAYYQIQKMVSVLEHGSDQEAFDLYSKISENVSEVSDFATLANYHKGRILLAEDKSAEALEIFTNCQGLPENYGVPLLSLQAEIGAAFDKKDYAGFVDASTRYLEYDTTSVALARAASAYACIYAEEKSDSARVIAMKYLQRDVNAHDTTQFFAEYLNRIEHRLATGEIIDQETFNARFPNGWSK